MTLTFALYFTLANPKVWDRLSASIRSTFNSEDEINGKTVATIPYLTGVIYEGAHAIYVSDVALRIRPVAAQGLQRDVPPEGARIAGRFIPGGVQPAVSSLIRLMSPCQLGHSTTIRDTFRIPRPLFPNDGLRIVARPASRKP